MKSRMLDIGISIVMTSLIFMTIVWFPKRPKEIPPVHDQQTYSVNEYQTDDSEYARGFHAATELFYSDLDFYKQQAEDCKR